MHDDERLGNLVETAIYSQWFHSHWIKLLRYARWKSGEVDIVALNPGTHHPDWALEVKWTDRFHQRPDELAALVSFARKTGMKKVRTTTLTATDSIEYGGLTIDYEPSSLYCYWVGKICVMNRLSSYDANWQGLSL